MSRAFIIFLAVLFLITNSVIANARPKKGFHTGPYIVLEGGVMQAKFDYDHSDSQSVGRDFEPAFGFLFGWNVRDDLSAEIQGRYTTNKNIGKREHIAGANLHAKWTLITNALTDFPTFRVLPFAKGGAASIIAALPGAIGSSKSTVVSYGLGPTVGLGVMFLWKKYFYFGVDVQEDFLFFDDINQTVNGVANTLVYKGGFHPSFGALLVAGVHY